MSLCGCLLETSGRQRPFWRKIGCSHANSELTSRFPAEIYVGQVRSRYALSILAKNCCFLLEPYSFAPPETFQPAVLMVLAQIRAPEIISGGLSSNLRYHCTIHTFLRKTSFMRNHKTSPTYHVCVLLNIKCFGVEVKVREPSLG